MKWWTGSGLPYVIALVLLAGLTAATRLPAPWRMDVTNDEMHHLKSWRNRYGTDDIYPLFLQRIESKGGMSPGKLELIRKVYRSSPLVQRGLIVLVDPQPPLFPVMAEVLEAVSGSSLVAERIPSALASVAAIVLMFLIGRELGDRVLGVWLGGLLAIGLLAQLYAGIGRPYAIAQAALIGVLYAFLVEQRRKNRSPWRLLVVALIAQSAQWMLWAAVGPLVLVEFMRRLRGGERVGTLIKQTWWYVGASCLLLVEMAVQLKNPTISQQGGVHALSQVWGHFATASPFAQAGSFGAAAATGAAVLFAVLAVVGVIRLWATRDAIPWVRFGLIAAFVTSVAAPLLIGSSVRFMMSYVVVPTVMAGIGARWLSGGAARSAWVVGLVLAGFGAVSLLRPEDPYRRVFPTDTRYSMLADVLKHEMKPGDRWVTWPYFFSNCLYRYGPLPDPIGEEDYSKLAHQLVSMPGPGSCYLIVDDGADRNVTLPPVLRSWKFPPDFVIYDLQLGAGDSAAVGRRVPPASDSLGSGLP